MTKTTYICKTTGVVGQMEEITSNVQQMYKSIFEAFLQHNRSFLTEAEECGLKAEKIIKEATDYLLSSDKQDENLNKAAVLHLLRSMEQVKYSAIKISGSVSNKIKDGVLFSDKAVTELKDIFGVVIECLSNVTDLVVTGNEVIAKHMINRASLYSQVIQEYSNEHEERLIKGFCLPKSSIIYLTMVDTLNDVLWNIREIGGAFRN